MDEILQAERDYVLKHFDVAAIFDFCLQHRVEALVQADGMVHCYVDYHLDPLGGADAIEITPLMALLKAYKNFEKSKDDGIITSVGT
jgi:hypothetical protein